VKQFKNYLKNPIKEWRVYVENPHNDPKDYAGRT
jgi:hypothetical protein